MPSPLRLGTFLLLAVLCGCTSVERLAIPEARAITLPQAEGAAAPDADVHAPWDEFLRRHARETEDGVVRLDYGAVDAAGRSRLQAYLDRLQATDPEAFSRDGQLAYWVNLYNAATVAVVLDHYPVDSIRAIRAHPLDPGPWDEHRLTVRGRALSLHDIEHGILRPNWPEDPEIHYVLNCAAVGCPNLGRAAYTEADVRAAMASSARTYVNDPRGVTVRPDGKVRLSKIYAWYREDFGGSAESILEHLREYASDALKARLSPGTRIQGYDYDWGLNDTHRSGARVTDARGEDAAPARTRD